MAETLILVGVLFIGAAVAGGLKLANIGEIGVLSSIERQLAVGFMGVLILGGGIYFRESDNFRVSAVSVTSDDEIVFFCPDTVTYTAVIQVEGSGGTVEYRFVHNGQPMAPYSIEFAGPTRRTIQQSVEVQGSVPGFGDIGVTDDRMALEVLAPNSVASAVATTQNHCQ